MENWTRKFALLDPIQSSKTSQLLRPSTFFFSLFLLILPQFTFYVAVITTTDKGLTALTHEISCFTMLDTCIPSTMTQHFLSLTHPGSWELLITTLEMVEFPGSIPNRKLSECRSCVALYDG
jgi:hypothetical protein